MGVRRDAREAAVQYLYQQDIHGGSCESGLAEFYELRGLSPSGRKFCDELLAGWAAHREEVDSTIAKASHHFDFQRLSAVDRNILRLACHEILHRDDIPPAVAINEAIEIAKKYGSEDSGRFVNGLLDAIRRQRAAGAAS